MTARYISRKIDGFFLLRLTKTEFLNTIVSEESHFIRICETNPFETVITYFSLKPTLS